MTFIASTGSEQCFPIYGRDAVESTSIRLARICIASEDFISADNLLKPFLQRNDPEALYLAASFSAHGESADDYLARRIMLLRKAAEQQYPPALFSLAVSYDTGDGVQTDKIKAAELYLLAAEQGHAHSQWICSIELLYSGGCTSDNRLHGVDLLFRSADQRFVGALETLAKLYEKGDIGFPKNIRLARYFRQLMSDDNIVGY